MGSTLTVKFISTEGTIGSTESTATRLDKLSRASGKFNITIGTSIKKSLASAKDDKKDPSPKTGTQQSNTRVVTKVIEDCSPEDASLIAMALFNHMEKEGNSDRYDEAKAKFDTQKRAVLAQLGVDNYDLLTPEQRKMYAKLMIERKAPFKYTERSIHIKYGQFQTIYSVTQRKMGKAHFNEDAYEKIVNLERLRQQYAVSFRTASADTTKQSDPPSAS